jgi:DHA3 family macrolide efflux protein-like MFS transporter
MERFMQQQAEIILADNWKVRFFSIWTGQAFSLLGSALVQFALIWWLTKTTGSATVLATASLVGFVPQIILGPFAGALVDRWNRRWTMIVADGLIALATLALVGLFWTGAVEVWHIYILLFFRSAAGGFHWPAMQASTSLMVPKEQLSRVQGINQTLQGLLNIGSAPLGALLLSVLPMHSVLAIDIFTALLAILPLLLVTIPQPQRLLVDIQSMEQPTYWQDLRAGFRYVWSWPGLVMILGMATVINLLSAPAIALLPLLVTKHFGGEAIQLAGLESAFGIGMLTGGLILSVWGGFRRRVMTSMLGLMFLGVGMIGVGMAPASLFLLAVGMMFVIGVGSPITNGPLFAVVQDVVAPEMQGRVLGLIGSMAAAMTPVGLVIAGPLSDWLGVQSWFIIGGISTFLMGVSGFFIPAIMNLEEKNRPAQEMSVTLSAASQPVHQGD